MVHIFESCIPIKTFSTQTTFLIQTEPVSITDLPGTIFKDNFGNCWIYNGVNSNNYIPPPDKFYITYQGNFFEKNGDLSKIFYSDCDNCVLTNVTACTINYFYGRRCDNSDLVLVKYCNVGPIYSPIQIKIEVGMTVGIKNPIGNDFCVTIETEVNDGITPYEISTPAWKNYDCFNCPLYKLYKVSSLDGLTNDKSVYTDINQDTLEVDTIVNLNNDINCYRITSYDGVVLNFVYNSSTDSIKDKFVSSGECFNNAYKII